MQHPFDNLSREELLALAKQQEAQLQQLRAQSQTPTLDMAEAGSIADAAVELSGVLQASQRAADIYLQSVEALKAKQESQCSLLLSEAQQQAQTMLQEAEEQYHASVTRAQESARFYWTEMHRKLDDLFARNAVAMQPLLQPPTPPEDEGFGPDD